MVIPYYQQEQEWSCGPASLRMVLASFGILKTELVLIKMLSTNSRVGTRNRSLP